MTPLVIVPQHFGSMVFDRRTSRYAPFDHQTTEILVRALGVPVWRLAADSSEVADFIACFERAGYFTPDGYLAGTLLPAVPPDGHLLGPLAVHVEVIAACQLSCAHCFAGELPRKTTLATPELDRVFGELAALGSFRLGLTGGEPLLRKDLFEVIDAALAHGLHPCLTTNGLLLDEELARALGSRDLVWLNVSLDAATAATNDRVRGAGTFDAVVERLRRFGKHMRFTLAFTITSDNAGEALACADLARELGAHTAVFRPVYPVGTARSHPALMPSFDQYTGALAKLAGEHAFSPTERVESQAITYSGPGCGAANLVASISSAGDVNPCSFLGADFESGNVRDRPFVEIWNAGQAFLRLRAGNEAFRGGCRARSLAAHGDVHARDPWHDAWLGAERAAPQEPGERLRIAGRSAPGDRDGEHPLANLHVKRYLPVVS
jgi:radical SAM protein with 4Fe4S-binding SPASM domain